MLDIPTPSLLCALITRRMDADAAVANDAGRDFWRWLERHKLGGGGGEMA